MAKKVIVLGETRDGEIRNVTFEAIAAAKKVADGGEVVGVLFGENASGFANEMIHYGADRVLTSEHSDLKQYTTDAYQQAILQVCDQESPEGLSLVILLQGRILLPDWQLNLVRTCIRCCGHRDRGRHSGFYPSYLFR